MKTVEGDEIELGKPTLMPVKNIVIKLTDKEIEHHKRKPEKTTMPPIHYCRLDNCRIEGNHVHVERSPFFQTEHYIKTAVEEYNLYHHKVITHLKPANYKD